MIAIARKEWSSPVEQHVQKVTKKPAERDKTRSAGSLFANSGNYFLAGAAGAAGAGTGAGAGAGAGTGAGAGAGAGASTLGAAAGFCSSAFLQPTTAKDNAAKKNRGKITTDTFFIETPPCTK
jgi:hypothetical protein